MAAAVAVFQRTRRPTAGAATPAALLLAVDGVQVPVGATGTS